MSPTVVSRIALGAALAAACSDRTAEPAAAAPLPAPAPVRPTGPVTARDPSGATVAAMSVSGTLCTASVGEATVQIERRGDGLAITGAPLAIQRTATGDQLLRSGQPVARVWRDPGQPGHVDVLDPDGLALVRISVTGAVASLLDASRAPVARIVFEGGRFVAKDPRDAVLAYITGGDAELAALLTAPLAPDLRAVAACDRLLPTAPAPVSP